MRPESPRRGRGKRMRPRVLAAMTVMLAALGVVGAPAQAADLSRFDPGYIISDAVFFNSTSMTQAQIQQFIDTKIPSCRSGYTCLNTYSQNTVDKPADAMCNGYARASNELASQIIFKVAQSCGINPQVLLVILQKEQSLVTNTAPTDSRYRSAMGQGCPDTAGCDTSYYGFQNQVYGAAWQFKRYANPPGTSQYFTWYPPGRTSSVRYNPDASCGSSAVFIQNQATANLYYYTPYQPNAAALSAGYGLGNACSSYGNRNFYNYFTDWFGSTTFVVGGSIRDYWMNSGGAVGPIGEPSAAMVTYPNGWAQQFANQDLTIRSGSSVVPVQGNIRSVYRSANGPAGSLGWAMSPEVAVPGGWWQQFELGRIYANQDGRTFAVRLGVGDYYLSRGAQSGTLGWPREDTRTLSGGLAQRFDGGVVYVSPSKQVELPGSVASDYELIGGPSSSMGWPTSGVVSDAAGSHVSFDGAWFYQSGTSRYWVKGDIGLKYVQLGAGQSSLGLPTSSEQTISGGWFQDFEHGSIYSSSAGTYVVPERLRDEYRSSGAQTGPLGYPIGDPTTYGGSVSQRFSGGYITDDGVTVARVQGAIFTQYLLEGGTRSAIGLPKENETRVGVGWVQHFARGDIVVGSAGTFSLPNLIADAYLVAGGAPGRLGWPTSSATPIGTTSIQRFQGGWIAGGTDGDAYPVWGAMLDTYADSSSALGAPVDSEQTVAGGWVQDFRGGTLFAPAGRSAVAVSGATLTAYRSMNAQASRLGWPKSPTAPTAGGWVQQFDGGAITERSATTSVVTGQIQQDWLALGGVGGRMGFPKQSEQSSSRGWVQHFDGGSLFVNRSTGQSLRVVGALADGYAHYRGIDGQLGWPIANEQLVGGKWSQRFEGGTLTLQTDGTFTIG